VAAEKGEFIPFKIGFIWSLHSIRLANVSSDFSDDKSDFTCKSIVYCKFSSESLSLLYAWTYLLPCSQYKILGDVLAIVLSAITSQIKLGQVSAPRCESR
jgi:hypothetical protein